MNQVLTPEEMAALFEGLRGAGDGSGSLPYRTPWETATKGRNVSERDPILSFPTISAWLMILADLRWPHL